MMENQIQRVRVINRNDFTITDRFDGIPYVFRPNHPVDLAPDVAEHILGYPGDPEDTHRYMAKRWGWNLPKHIAEDRVGIPLWERWAAKIEIATERFELRRVTDPNAPIPADSPEGRDGEATMLEPPARPRRQQSSQEVKDRMAKVRAARQAKKEKAVLGGQAVQHPAYPQAIPAPATVEGV